MGLVEINPRQPPQFRVRFFRRADDKLILLWHKIPQIGTEIPKITAKCIEDGKELSLQSVIDDDDKRSDGVICVIKESLNGMDPSKNYYVTVAYSKVRYSLKVYREGVYPDEAREDQDKNVHTYLWDSTKQRWRKQEGVEVVLDVDGKKETRFAALTTIVPCPKCGYTGEK